MPRAVGLNVMKNSLWWIAAWAMLASLVGGCQSESSGATTGDGSAVSKEQSPTGDGDTKKPIADPRTMDPGKTGGGEKPQPKSDGKSGAVAKKPPADDFRTKPVDSPTGGVKKTEDGPVGQYKASFHLEKGIRTVVFGLMEDKTLVWTESIVGVEPEQPTKRFTGVWSVSGNQVTIEVDFDGRKEKLVGTLDGRSLLVPSYDKARYPTKTLEFFKR